MAARQKDRKKKRQKDRKTNCNFISFIFGFFSLS